MLQRLHITNYALIRRLEMTPDTGLNIITGETGAGKSIMLGAIGLLLGERADTSAMHDADQKCIVEGHFRLEGDHLRPVFEEADLDWEPDTVIRREISPSGKSRAFVNDTPANLDILRRLGQGLMDVHSQHDTLQLGSNEYQLSLLDGFAQASGDLKAFQAAYSALRKAEAQATKLANELTQARKEEDYTTFVLSEIEKANPQPDEVPELEQELQVLENAEEIQTRLQTITSLFDHELQGILPQLKQVQTALEKLSSYGPAYAGLAGRVATTLIELRDVAAEVEDKAAHVELDPKRTLWVQDRLSLLYNLLKKHGLQEPEELIALRKDLSGKTRALADLEVALEQAKAKLQSSREAAEAAAKALSERRKAAAPVLEAEIARLLANLGMPEARLQVTLKTTPLSLTGADKAEFLFSANKGREPQPLRAVASGGEFSRLMLAVKYVLAGKVALPTIIFDEIDAGISGEVARKVAQLIEDMSARHQLIAITHLPQIASKGTAHYYVYKDNTEDKTISRIRPLSPEERVEEIAQMISGNPPTPAALTSARELLHGQTAPAAK